jgi:hypothetical protein
VARPQRSRSIAARLILAPAFGKPSVVQVDASISLPMRHPTDGVKNSVPASIRRKHPTTEPASDEGYRSGPPFDGWLFVAQYSFV